MLSEAPDCKGGDKVLLGPDRVLWGPAADRPLAQGISSGCRVRGRCPESQGLFAAMEKAACPDCVLLPVGKHGGSLGS